jgi:predicted metal-dependent hydrolase
LKRSPRRRTVAISIHPEQGLVVYSPARLSLKWLEEVLQEKAGWILSKTQEVEDARALISTPRWEAGESLPYQGGSLPLRISHDPTPTGVRLEDEALILNLPFEFPEFVTPERVRLELVGWYREQARRVLNNRVAHFQGHTGLRARVVRIKDQKRRWGSCSAEGALNFNWRLILAPPDILDYVVVHEVCHLRMLNHSAEFWRLVGSVLPDYRERRAWLRHNGIFLSL